MFTQHPEKAFTQHLDTMLTDHNDNPFAINKYPFQSRIESRKNAG